MEKIQAKRILCCFIALAIILIPFAYSNISAEEQITPFQKFIIEALSLKDTPRIGLYKYMSENLGEGTKIQDAHVKNVKTFLTTMTESEILNALKIYSNRSQTSQLGILLLITEGLHEINGDLTGCIGIANEFNSMIMANPTDNRGIEFMLTILSQIKLITGKSVAFNNDDKTKIRFKLDDFSTGKEMISNAIDLMETLASAIHSADGATSFDKLMNFSENMINNYTNENINAFKIILKTNGDIFGDPIEIFSDIDSATWAKEAINSLATSGVLAGVSYQIFEPNNPVTREQFVKMIVKAFKMNDDEAQAEFTDVSNEAWYYDVIASSKKLGIVTGYPDGSFGVGKNITRQEAAAILCRTAGLIKSDLTPKTNEKIFEDEQDIGDYAKEAVNTLQRAGIINGFTDNTFSPQSNTTRAQAATLIYRVLLQKTVSAQ